MVDLRDRIEQAVLVGRQVRSECYGLLKLADEQVLGQPATDIEIHQLEEFLQQSLPPSYRQFLEMYNGWRMVSGPIDLLSTQDVIACPNRYGITKWRTEVVRGGDEISATSLVIAASEISVTKVLLDPKSVDQGGEWLVIEHEYGPERTFDSFIDWLDDSTRGFAQLIERKKS